MNPYSSQIAELRDKSRVIKNNLELKNQNKSFEDLKQLNFKILIDRKASQFIDLQFNLNLVLQDFFEVVNEQELLAIASKQENSYYSFDLYTGKGQ